MSIPTFLDTAVVSIPAILGEAPARYWVTPFVPPPSEEAPAEKMQQQEETPGAPAPAPAKAPAAPNP